MKFHRSISDPSKERELALHQTARGLYIEAIKFVLVEHLKETIMSGLLRILLLSTLTLVGVPVLGAPAHAQSTEGILDIFGDP
jgi:hypothetical protein